MDAVTKPLPNPPNKYIEHQVSGIHLTTRDQITNKMTGETRTQVKVDDSNENDDDEDFEFFHEFERDKVKVLIHFITAELKERGVGVEYLMIPFRPQQTNEKLLSYLNTTFPMGNGQPVSESQQVKIIAKTEPLTLFQALKYIWCRLPEGEVIGWKAYLEFKIKEQTKDYPKKAFLEIMPQCLSSASHASIVYDFFDLIITMASNSKKNKMSARKISKMCAIWAFGKPMKTSGMLDYDFTDISPYPNNSFQDGLNQWIPGTDAMFHLLLAFLKSFVPQDLESAQLPLALKSLLFNNDYPPKKSTAYSSETILTIPLVSLRTGTFSRKPWELIERCNEKLDFSNHEAFEAREDYALLKSLFKKKNNVEGISRKMSQESKRLMKSMSTKHSTFQAGWASRKCLPNVNHLTESVEVKRVEIDDYFIWAWLSTLSYEQTSEKKKLFGRSLILEFEFDGFKKWVLFEESDITLDSKKKQDSTDNEIAEDVSQFEKVEEAKAKNRNITPAYEKFQHQVPSPPSSQEEKLYHTVISKDSFGKPKDKHNIKLHSIEQKISKWNPLSKVKKKGVSDNLAATNPDLNSNVSGKKRSALLDSTIFQLPELEPDAQGFEVDFPDEDMDTMSIRQPSPLPTRRTPPGEYSDTSHASSGYSKEPLSPKRSPVSRDSPSTKDSPTFGYISKELPLSTDQIYIRNGKQEVPSMQKELPLPKTPHQTQLSPGPERDVELQRQHQYEQTMTTVEKSNADRASPTGRTMQAGLASTKNDAMDARGQQQPSSQYSGAQEAQYPAQEYNSYGAVQHPERRLPVPTNHRDNFSPVRGQLPPQFQVNGSPVSQHHQSHHSPVRDGQIHEARSPVSQHQQTAMSPEPPLSRQEFESQSSPVRRREADDPVLQRRQHPDEQERYAHVEPRPPSNCQTQDVHSAVQRDPRDAYPGAYNQHGEPLENKSPVDQEFHDAENRISLVMQRANDADTEGIPGAANYRTEETIEHLKGMVEEMMFEENNNVQLNNEEEILSPERETFETLTKFELYKPSAIKESRESLVQPLNVPQPVNSEYGLRVAPQEDLQHVQQPGPRGPPRETLREVPPLAAVPRDMLDRDVGTAQQAARPDVPRDFPEAMPRELPRGYPEAMPREDRHGMHPVVPRMAPTPQAVAQYIPPGGFGDQRGPGDQRQDMYQDRHMGPPPTEVKRQPMQSRSPQTNAPPQHYRSPHVPHVPHMPQATQAPMPSPMPLQTQQSRHYPPQIPQEMYHQPRQMNQQRMYTNQQHVPMPQYPRNTRMHSPVQQPALPQQSQQLQQPHMAPAAANMKMFIPEAPQGNKLHGGVINKRQERKNLYNNIRNGNFGI